MNLKQRFSLYFSLLFSLLLAVVMLVVYYLFAKFREEEFQDRLAEKAATTVKLLLEVKEVDYQMLKIIDRNTINNLYNEKILVFNDSMQLIYSSLDDAVIQWNRAELAQIKNAGRIFQRNRDYDILGIYYQYEQRDYFVLVSAEDTYGISKLNYLKYLLVGAFLVSTVLVWVFSFSVSRKGLAPLDRFKNQMQDITDKNLNLRLPESPTGDEINALSRSFNQMMNRIDQAYQRQREFTGTASHELRTPLARIITQLENVLQTRKINPEVEAVLKSISEDIYQLSDIVSSLLLLSEMDNKGESKFFQSIRLDELLFLSASQLSKLYPDFKLYFEIENGTSRDLNLEILGDETLLKIALVNLLKNAYLYSDHQTVNCVLRQEEKFVELRITNQGAVPQIEDTDLLFQTFRRGTNVRQQVGSGVGLSIVRRILQYHDARVQYQIPDNRTNMLIVTFPQDFKS